MVDPAELAPERIRPLSRREYERMAELGMFEDERVELLRGVIITKSPQGEHHGSVVSWLVQRLSIALGMSFQVRPALPLAADDYSEPEPDVAVCTRDHGVHQHPTAALLLIEVSYTSLRKDRGVKLQIYADAGIPEYWIVDITTMTVESTRTRRRTATPPSSACTTVTCCARHACRASSCRSPSCRAS